MIIDQASFVPAELCQEAKFMLQIILRRWSIATEQGCCTIIDLFLLDALHKRDDAMAVFPEYRVTGSIPGTVKDDVHHHCLCQGFIEVPLVIVVEAKKEDNFIAGVTQLLAEMKLIWSQHPEDTKREVFRALTSGILWCFFLLAADGFHYFFTEKGIGDFSFDQMREQLLLC